MPIAITVNTIDLGMNGKRILIEQLKEVLEGNGVGYTLVSDSDDNENWDVENWDVINRQNIREVDRQDTNLLNPDEITEDEYNNLFSSDRTDQFNDVEDDIMKRSEEYKGGRPLDP